MSLTLAGMMKMNCTLTNKSSARVDSTYKTFSSAPISYCIIQLWRIVYVVRKLLRCVSMHFSVMARADDGSIVVQNIYISLFTAEDVSLASDHSTNIDFFIIMISYVTYNKLFKE